MTKPTTCELINVKLPLQSESVLFSLKLEDGKWVSVKPQSTHIEDANAVSLDHAVTAKINVEGKLLLPGFVDAHMHMDKAFSLPTVTNRTGTLEEAVHNYSIAATTFTKDEIKSRIIRVALQALAFGTTSIRSHLDFVGSPNLQQALNTYEAAIEARQMLSPYMNLQFVAMFPIEMTPIALEGLDIALQMGIDGIGGAPHLSKTPETTIDEAFRLAAKHRCFVDFHADESDDPEVRTVEYMVKRTLEYGMEGNVAVGHLCALAAMPDKDAHHLIKKMQTAGFQVLAMPAVNLYLQGRHDRYPIRRGVTRIRDFQVAGIPVAIGSDNIHDPFHPFGRGDLLQIGLISAYAAHMGSSADIRTLLQMMTRIPAKLTGFVHDGVEPGANARFVIFDSRSPEELFTMIPERRWVYTGGEWVRVAPPKSEWRNPVLTQLWEDASHFVSFKRTEVE